MFLVEQQNEQQALMKSNMLCQTQTNKIFCMYYSQYGYQPTSIYTINSNTLKPKLMLIYSKHENTCK